MRQFLLLEVGTSIFLTVLQIYLAWPQALRVLQLFVQVWNLKAIRRINEADALERLSELLIPQHIRI